MAPKKMKTPGKSAKRGTKPQSSARPVRKSAAKSAKKTAGGSARKPAKPVAKRSAPKAVKAKAVKSAPKKAAAKQAPAARPAARRPAAGRSAAVKTAAPRPKAKAGTRTKAPGAKPVPPARGVRTFATAAKAPTAVKVPTAASAPPAQRHPQRRPEAPAAKGKSAVKAGTAAATAPPVVNPTSRPVSAVRALPAAKRPFSRESVRVGESRFAQPAGARPVFPADFLQRQRERLLVKKQEILAMYQKDLRSGQESNDSPTEDLVDRANNAYTRELAFSISDSERELMRQIDLAIERLNSGSYGFCLHTGQQIGQARLEALPWAKYSVEAQELLEKGLLSEA